MDQHLVATALQGHPDNLHEVCQCLHDAGGDLSGAIDELYPLPRQAITLILLEQMTNLFFPRMMQKLERSENLRNLYAFIHVYQQNILNYAKFLSS